MGVAANVAQPPLEASIRGVLDTSVSSQEAVYALILLALSAPNRTLLNAIPRDQGAKITISWGAHLGAPRLHVETALTPGFLGAIREAAK